MGERWTCNVDYVDAIYTFNLHVASEPGSDNVDLITLLSQFSSKSIDLGFYAVQILISIIRKWARPRRLKYYSQPYHPVLDNLYSIRTPIHFDCYQAAVQNMC